MTVIFKVYHVFFRTCRARARARQSSLEGLTYAPQDRTGKEGPGPAHPRREAEPETEAISPPESQIASSDEVSPTLFDSPRFSLNTRSMTRTPLVSRAALPLVALALVACGQAATDSGKQGGAEQPLDEQKDAKNGLEKRREEIRALAGENVACTANEECRALAFGSKACGGPSDYLVYATSSGGAAELESAVEAFNNDETAYNQEYEVVSDCSFLMEPAVHCDAGRCAIAP